MKDIPLPQRPFAGAGGRAATSSPLAGEGDRTRTPLSMRARRVLPAALRPPAQSRPLAGTAPRT